MAADIVFIVAVLATVFIIAFSMGRGTARPEIIDHSDTVIVIRHDTTLIDSPVPVYREVVRTEYLAVTDTIVRNDTAFVPVPVERKVYEDSTYRAVVSGYHPSLDSLWIYKTKAYITVTNTVQEPRKKFGVSVGVGPAVIYTPFHDLHLDAGIGIFGGITYTF